MFLNTIKIRIIYIPLLALCFYTKASGKAFRFINDISEDSLTNTTCLVEDHRINNFIYFELFGTSRLYSINYERFINNNILLRVGYSKWSWDHLGKINIRRAIPFGVSYNIGREKIKFETGIGVQYVDVKYQKFLLDASSYSGLLFFGIIGLRFQPLEFGEYYRICFSYVNWPWNSEGTIGISGGVCF